MKSFAYTFGDWRGHKLSHAESSYLVLRDTVRMVSGPNRLFGQAGITPPATINGVQFRLRLERVARDRRHLLKPRRAAPGKQMPATPGL